MIAACAITNLGTIGIDVEFRAGRSFPAIAAAAFGPGEQRVVTREGGSAFYRIWSLREALAKARLNGIERLTDGCDYFADAPGTGTWSTVIDNQRWMFWTGILPGNYAAATAIAPRSPISAPDTVSLVVEPFSE
jgi:phosphopantetheinyl transferase